MAEEKPDVKPDGEVHIQIKVKSQVSWTARFRERMECSGPLPREDHLLGMLRDAIERLPIVGSSGSHWFTPATLG